MRFITNDGRWTVCETLISNVIVLSYERANYVVLLVRLVIACLLESAVSYRVESRSIGSSSSGIILIRWSIRDFTTWTSSFGGHVLSHGPLIILVRQLGVESIIQGVKRVSYFRSIEIDRTNYRSA